MHGETGPGLLMTRWTLETAFLPTFFLHSFRQDPPEGNETDVGFWMLPGCLEVDSGDSPGATE